MDKKKFPAYANRNYCERLINSKVALNDTSPIDFTPPVKKNVEPVKKDVPDELKAIAVLNPVMTAALKSECITPPNDTLGIAVKFHETFVEPVNGNRIMDNFDVGTLLTDISGYIGDVKQKFNDIVNTPVGQLSGDILQSFNSKPSNQVITNKLAIVEDKVSRDPDYRDPTLERETDTNIIKGIPDYILYIIIGLIVVGIIYKFS